MIDFPRTPHLAWLGPGAPREDKVLSPEEAREFLNGNVVVEEKIDGANIGFGLSVEGGLVVFNRGELVDPDNLRPQFRPLRVWLAARTEALVGALGSNLVLFGEWCYAVHSVHYDRLPDWFLGFDVYDVTERRFFSTGRRDALLRGLGLYRVPRIARGRFSLDNLMAMFGRSRFGDGPAEGLYLRREGRDWVEGRAKLVRPEFVQAIGEHWSRMPLRRNLLAPPAQGTEEEERP